MGDYFEVIVDVEATSEDSVSLTKMVTEFLSAEEIIEPRGLRLTHLEGISYPWGRNAHLTVEEPQAFPRGIITSMEGLEVIAGRQIHGESEESPVWIQCPKCENRKEDDFSLWFDATANWYNAGIGYLECRRCKENSPVQGWKHYPLWVYGNLGFRFWNIPKLRSEFVDSVSHVLGHKTVVVEGSI